VNFNAEVLPVRLWRKFIEGLRHFNTGLREKM